MSLPDIHSTLDFTLEPIRLEPVQPSEYEKLLYQAYEVSLAAVRNTDTATGPWVYNSTQEDIEIFTKKPAGSNTECSKGIGIIDAPPLLVSTLFNSPDWRPQWDGMHDRGERLDQMDQFTSVNYNSFKAPWPVSGRDFVAIGRSVILPPSKVPGLENETNMDIGAVFTFSIACESPKCPPKKGLVRGVLHFCGLWIEAIPGQPNRSKVIYTLGSDPMGSIPKSLVNAANVKQPLCIAAIRNVLAKNPKLRGEVEKKIETERQKSIKIREQKKGAESAATPSVPIAGSSSSSSIASATDPSSASASASATTTAAADADVEIDDANLPFPPSPYDAALAKAYDAAMSAIQSVGATDGWVFNSRQEEVDIFLKTTPGSTVNSCKGVGFIDADVETVDLVFNNNMYRNKWDEICEVSKEVKILDWSTSINYSAFAAPWPVSARDFIAVGRSVDEPLGKEKSAGVKFSWSISIDDDKLAPKKKGYIRGTLHFAGLWIEPVPGQPNRSKVIYTLSSDPNGSIPKAIVNGANIKQPLCIRTVGKFIQTSPDIVEKMRIQQRKEAETAQQLKAEWKRKLAKKPSASSSSEESPALALSNLSSSLVLTSDAFNALTPESLPFDLVAELLKLSLHSTSGDLSQPYYVQWSKDRVFVPEHLDLLAEIEGRAVMASEEDHISPAGLATKLVTEVVKCAMGWTKHEPTVSLRPSLTSQADSPSAAPSPSAAAAAAAAAAASVNNSTPPMGVLYFELIDLRQVVSTLQSAHLAAERLEKEKDKDGYFGSVFQQCFIHLELVGDPNPQGQVCHASIDLANPGALGSFTVAPTAVCFRVTNPNARLAVSLYTQKLDIIEFPSSGSGSGGNGGSGSLSRELTSQSVGGKLRNLVNPLALGGAVASGLESGFDSFLHVFDPSSKGTGATLEALNNAAKHPHPIVCVARASFDIMLDLGAPTKQHSRLQWRELEDGEGWNLAHPTTYDELLAKRSPARVNNSAIGNMVNGVIKKSSTNSNSVIGDAHPLLHVHSQTTHALLVHSYFVTTSKQDVLQAYLKHSLTPSFPSAHSSDYIILFQTLDGVFDLIRLNESQRDLAIVTYEKMQVGLSKAQAASVGVSSRTSSKNAVTSHTPPVFVSKLLLSPTHHLLAATWFDLSRKRDLLAYARRLLRVELMTCLQSIDNDVLQPRRSAQATPIANPVPANLKSTTLHTNLHPLKQFGSTQFVVAYTACLQTLKSLLLIALAVCRILAWSDVYLSFFVLMTFLFLAFNPSFITIVLPLITIITLVRQAARAYFEQHLKHAQKSEEYERRKLKEKERFMSDTQQGPKITLTEVIHERLFVWWTFELAHLFA